MKKYFRFLTGLLAMVVIFLLLPQQTLATGQQYTVTYDANGGAGAPEAQMQEKGTALIISEQTPYYNGYIFKGWSKTRYGDLAYQPADNYTGNEDVTLYAVWVAKCYYCQDGVATVTCSKCNGRGGRTVIRSNCHDYSVAETIGQYGTMFYQCQWCWFPCTVYKEGVSCETTEIITCRQCSGTGWNKTSAPAAPKPELQEVTTNTITVVAQTGMQYSIDQTNWQTNNTFDGLDAGSEYIVYQRYAPSDMYYAGKTSEGLTVTTEAQLPPPTEEEPTVPTCWHYDYKLYIGDETQHSWVCTVCGYTEMEDHTYAYACAPKCEVCGRTRSITHSITSDWGRDRRSHWRWCDKCGTVLNEAEHIPGEKATETKHQTCTVCGYVIQPALGHIHSFAEGWTADKTGHWHACSGCSEAEGFAEHTPGSEATEGTDQTCTVCGYVIQPALGHAHSFSANWMADKTSHWRVCSGCEEKDSFAEHTPGPEATADSDQTCTVCGKTLAKATGETSAPTDATEPPVEVQPDSPQETGFLWLTVAIIALVAAVASSTVVFVLIQKKKQKNETTSPE